MTRLSRLLVTSAIVLIATLASACADETTGPASAPGAALVASDLSQAAHSPSGRASGFTHCTPQASDTTSARIGPSGGVRRTGSMG